MWILLIQCIIKVHYMLSFIFSDISHGLRAQSCVPFSHNSLKVYQATWLSRLRTHTQARTHTHTHTKVLSLWRFKEIRGRKHTLYVCSEITVLELHVRNKLQAADSNMHLGSCSLMFKYTRNAEITLKNWFTVNQFSFTLLLILTFAYYQVLQNLKRT